MAIFPFNDNYFGDYCEVATAQNMNKFRRQLSTTGLNQSRYQQKNTK